MLLQVILGLQEGEGVRVGNNVRVADSGLVQYKSYRLRTFK